MERDPMYMANTPQTLTESILADHLVSGSLKPNTDISISVDQVLLQDVLGPLVWMEFEALEFDKVQPNLVVTYADHQVYEFDQRDTATHRYLRTVAQHHGGYYSKAGNGICHQVHRERFIKPGCTLLGSDSHSTTAGGFGAFGIGAGGLDVAVSMGGEPYTFEMPNRVNVQLVGELDKWVSAKDVTLELLRRLSVEGGVGSVIEFTGPGIKTLSVPERCTITNMTTELGATTSLFPSDERTRRHLARLGREGDYQPLTADEGAEYDESIKVDLSDIVPLIAAPSMPDNVVPVAEVAGTEADQVIVGSCTNGSYTDIATVADIIAGESVAAETDMVVIPASKRASELIAREGKIADLYAAGVNLSESTCGACIGQGHVPASGTVSLRTFNRNFKGRSGNEEDAVYLCSPEVAAVSAVYGEITDPRTTGLKPPDITLPNDMTGSNVDILSPDANVEVQRGETIGHVPLREPLTSDLSGTLLLKVGDNISTDHIMPATAEVMSLWSDPQAAADYTLARIDEQFSDRARAADGGWIVAGENYGQGSSRENAALEPAVLGVNGVLAQSFARIHVANLFNFGVIPLTFENPAIYEEIQEGDSLEIIDDVAMGITNGQELFTMEVNNDWQFEVRLKGSEQERVVLAGGGKLQYLKQQHTD